IPRSMTAFTAIAWYNAVEVLVLIFFVFKRYSGLYFWSLLITTLAVYNNVSHDDPLTKALLTIGWVIMVPGQSMILYSRLHLVSPNPKLLRFTLWLVIVNSILLCSPTAVLNLCSRSFPGNRCTHGYGIMGRIQITFFTVQELFISGVYFWGIRRILKVTFDEYTRNFMWSLVAMNILIIILDITLMVIEFLDLYVIATTFKSMVYSVKLMVEFCVLSQLGNIIKGR
ncbi:hypothetical protein NA57DRAFT_18660, partial [Rhizodiscina lignyota]